MSFSCQVRVAVALVTRYQVPANNVAVICTTKAQCLMVRDKLSAAENLSPSLTITKSQGTKFVCLFVCLLELKLMKLFRILISLESSECIFVHVYIFHASLLLQTLLIAWMTSKTF